MHCTHCGEYTTSRGPFGEALHRACWGDQDDLIEQVERRTAEKHGYDREHYMNVDAAAKVAKDTKDKTVT